jgi:hypothetical protein
MSTKTIEKCNDLIKRCRAYTDHGYEIPSELVAELKAMDEAGSKEVSMRSWFAIIDGQATKIVADVSRNQTFITHPELKEEIFQDGPDFYMECRFFDVHENAIIGLDSCASGRLAYDYHSANSKVIKKLFADGKRTLKNVFGNPPAWICNPSAYDRVLTAE